MTTRRPIAARNNAMIRDIAQGLAERGVAPNTISMASVVCAALACLALSASAWGGPFERFILLLGAALCVQGRLICNLLDGLVAVEGGRSAPDGAFWNEAPDRLSDLLILAGVGTAAFAPALGLLAAALAICTAYLREFGRAEGQAPDYSGPMAKPQRMAVATVTLVLASLAVPLGWSFGILQLGLWVITLGTVATIALRSMTVLRGLSRG